MNEIKLGDSELRVLGYMGNEWVYPFSALALGTGLNMAKTKRATRSLRKKGFVEVGTAFDQDDGTLRGSGHLLTTAGIVRREQMSVNAQNSEVKK